MTTLSIDSEIGRLKRLVLHTPGQEIEAMTPDQADEDLYNDIIPLDPVKAEFDRLKAFLDRVSSTFELKDLLAESISAAEDRADFLAELAGCCPIRGLADDLMAMEADALAAAVIGGIPAAPGSLGARLSLRAYASRPLPNAYFMRDSVAVVGDCVVAAATAYDVRLVESIVTRFIFTRHPGFKARELMFDGPAERNRYVTAEGGDILVLSDDVMAIGISGRTSAAAVEAIARNAARLRGKPVRVYAVELPRERATIHLDMVFTMVDRDAALIYGPVIMGKDRSRVVRIDADPSGILAFDDEDSLLKGLARVGLELEPVLCASGVPLYQEREQWLSGANSFAFAPGQIITYSCNSRTLEALACAGFQIAEAERFISGVDHVERYGRLAVTFDGIELARGGGGARCMTLPVERAPV